MPDIEKPLTLRDRPTSPDLSWLKWLAGLSGLFAFAFICLSLIAQFVYFRIPGDGESDKELRYSSVFETSGNAGKYLFILAVTAALLRLISKALDRADMVIWLKADDQTRRELISLKDKNAKNK